MILLDFSQIVHSNVHSLNKAGNLTSVSIKEACLRSIRKYLKKFKATHNHLVICIDSDSYWRKEFFPNYKVRRHTKPDKINWAVVNPIVDAFCLELAANFPYKTICVPGAEADDIIAILTLEYANEPIVICSGDHDFRQLQVSTNVSQYSPVMDVFVVEENPGKYLKEHIIRGDDRDDIPNFLSPDNTYLEGIRQKRILSEKLEVWLSQEEPKEFCETEEILKNYQRNQTLIDFSKIPENIKVSILDAYNKEFLGDARKIFSYLKRERLKLFDIIRDFV